MPRESFESPEDRLPGQPTKLEPKLQDALDHPVRRELLRTLNRSARSRSTVEIRADLQPFRPSQLSYHLQVLRRSGVVASDVADRDATGSGPRYASEVAEDGEVRAVLRATERGDMERREAAVAASASPLLTMFRTPRPVRTIRLRGRTSGQGDESSG
ncbi:MAG TPA: helix-turn-helix domain-containing protein [Solirubrobacterales bacterium]|nr:helix-turn-helix domain-containing protein [Solirubrobacterales bacterium]